MLSCRPEVSGEERGEISYYSIKTLIEKWMFLLLSNLQKRQNLTSPDSSENKLGKFIETNSRTRAKRTDEVKETTRMRQPFAQNKINE